MYVYGILYVCLDTYINILVTVFVYNIYIYIHLNHLMYVRRKLLQAYIFGMITFQVHRQLYRECNGDYAQVAAMPLPRIDLSEGAEIEWHELAH